MKQIALVSNLLILCSLFSSKSKQYSSVQFSSVFQSCLTLSDHVNHSTPGLPVHHQLPEFTQTSVHWCHRATSSSVIAFSSRPQSLPASGSFPMSQLFAWGGQSIGVSASASVLSMWSIWWQLPYLAFQLHLQTYPIESLKAERPFENSQMINSRAFLPSPFPRELVVKP